LPAPQQLQLDAPVPLTASWVTEANGDDEFGQVEDATPAVFVPEVLPIVPAKPVETQRSIFL
jgi:hypothetical protein